MDTVDSQLVSSPQEKNAPDKSDTQPSAPPVLYGWKGFTGDLSLRSYSALSTHKIHSVAAGGGHVLFLTGNGKIFARGHNAHGQLGLGEELKGNAQFEPVFVSALSGLEVVAVAAGRSHSAAVTVNGDVYCWGDSSDGQCGTGSLEDVLVPTQVKVAIQEGFCEHGIPRPETRVAIDNVSCGATHTLALSVNEEIWTWGCGEQLGLEDLLHAPVPRRIDSLTGRRVLMVACGDNHSLAVLLKPEHAPKQNISAGGRYKNVSKENTVTHKYYPSKCATCSKEIYTYTETNDTCIIDNHHECHSDETITDFDSSTVVDLASSELNSSKLSSVGDSSVFHQSPDKDSDDMPGEKTSNPDSQYKKGSKSMTEESSENNDLLEVLGNCSQAASESLPGHNVLELSDRASTDLAEKSSSVLHQPFQSDPDYDKQNPADGSNETNCDKNISASAKNYTSTSTNVPARTNIFADENEARNYLTQQFEDRKHEEVSSKPSSSEEETAETESSWKNFLSSPSNVMETMKTMTTKAVSSFQTTMDSWASVPNMELKELSGVGAATTDHHGSVPGDQVGRAMSESCSSLDLGLEMTLESKCLDEGRSSQSPPNVLQSPSNEDSQARGRQSIRTLEMKQQNIQRRISAGASNESGRRREAPQNEVIMDTEIWSWGQNDKGQLGLGDNVNRNKPVCIKVMSSKYVLKVSAGANHNLALTASSQVYAWGSNNYGQLGHTDTGISPSKIKFMKGSCIWDLAGGTSHSVFLADSSGMKPDVFYCGKQPGKNSLSSIQKTTVPTSVNELKKLGWIRGLAAGGESSYCLCGTSKFEVLSVLYELAASERAFHQELMKTNTFMLKPLTKSSFFTVMDVFPYKSSLRYLVTSFTALSKMIGEGVNDLAEVVRQDQPVMSASLLHSYSHFIEEYRRYSQVFADFLAIGGFEFCIRTGSESFDKFSAQCSPSRSVDQRSGGKPEQSQNRFKYNMRFPFLRLKEYSRLFQKLVDNYTRDSEVSDVLQKAVVEWDTLKLTVTSDHKTADCTRAFWEGASPRLVDSLCIPSRRVLRDSKTHPLMLSTAGRFSSHLFILFNDMLVHLQSSTHSIYPLETLWVETPVTDGDQAPGIVLISPEDKIELTVSSHAEKGEWLVAFNSAINRVLYSQKDVGRRRSAERLSPPLARHAVHTFERHSSWKDGTYIGAWLNGRMHGQGEIKWTDGRKYRGTFKHGLPNGHGVYVIPRGANGLETQEGNWKDSKLNGFGHIRYANGDSYKGYFQNGQRFGHGVLQQGHHLSSYASIYIGEWLYDKRDGYGVQDDILKGEKYLGMWTEDHRHGRGIIVTLDGMYFEGNFSADKLTGFGLMLTDDNSCYEGEFMDITQLSGKGTLTLPTADKLEGTFSGSWNEGLKISGTFIKSNNTTPDRKPASSPVKSKYFGQLSVSADEKWADIFHHCCSSLGHNGSGSTNTKKAWDMVAVAVSSGKQQLKGMHKTSAAKAKLQAAGLEELEIIPPHDAKVSLTMESYDVICQYLRKAFDTSFHPLGELMENLVDVFRAAYVGIGAHPTLLHHAVLEVNSFVRRLYAVLRILFPQLPANGGPLHVYPEDYQHPTLPTTTEQDQNHENVGKVVTAAGLLYPILLPKIYPPLFDLYALFNDRSDDLYWERVCKLNRQGDMALMAFLGIDQKYWLMDEILLEDRAQKLSSTRDVCYASAVDALQQLSTAFSPMEKLLVIENSFNEITQTVQSMLGEDHVWCMDELFPIFQFVVVRAKMRHLGAEISMIDDLMERHMEHGELGIMFTTLKASFFQIQNEKMPYH